MANSLFGIQEIPKSGGMVARIARRIGDLLGRQKVPSIPVDNPASSATGVPDVTAIMRHDSSWAISYNRRQIYIDLRDMDQQDPIISSALDIIADCTTGYEDDQIDAFEWQMDKKNPEAFKILTELKQRLELGTEAWHIVRNYVRNGEEFREIVVSSDNIVRRFVHLPNYTVTPKFDERGLKIPGWEQRIDPSNMQAPIEFAEWQICPFVYGAKRGWYGTGLMLPARRDWKRLVKMEDGMALARMIRAYDKRIHRVPVQPNWDEKRCQMQITNYRNNIQRRKGLDEQGNVFLREWPEGVETDIFIPDDGSGRGGVELLEAENVQLQNVSDVEYHQNRLLARIKVPRKYMNLGSGTTGALTDGGLSAEDRQFARTLRQVQAVERQGFLRLAAVALLLQGFDAEELGVNLQMPKISTEDALLNSRIQMNEGQAARFFAEVMNGLPPELVADKFLQLDPSSKDVFMKWVVAEEKKTEEERKRMEKLMAPPPQNGSGRPQLPKRRGLMRPDNKRSVDAQNAPTLGDVADAVTQWQMMAQSAMERSGDLFGVGYEERRERNRQILQEMFAAEL